jgi:hypothetical protein
MHTYALLLDADYHRLEGELLESGPSVADRSAHVRRLAERAEELEAFRRAVVALRRDLGADRDSESPV